MALSFQDKIKTKGTTTTPVASNLSFASKIKPVPPPEAPQESMVGGMLKGLVSAPATMVARPFQAVQSAVQLAGMDIKGNTEKARALSDEAYRLALSLRTAPDAEKPAIKARVQELNSQASDIANKLGEGAAWKPSAGGIIAEAPETFADVKKDVGRAVETVALGMGSPLAAGAAFGFGSSLEQGNDIMSTETLISTLTGMGLGKAVDIVGKPILNAAGKVIGAVTPKMLKEVASKGAGAVSDFMAQHELLGGIAKPLSEKITAGAQTFDTTINKTVSDLWKGTKGAVSGQYPGVTKENIAKHFEKVETDRMMPDKGGVYNKARDVVDDAKRRGVDIKQKLKDNKVYADEHIIDGKYDTKATAEALKDEAKNGGAEFLRPALREAEMGVERVPIQDVRNQIIAEIGKQPASSLSPQQKLTFMKNVAKEYSGVGAEAATYRNGYGLEDLYNSKLQRTSGLYKTPKTGGVSTISDTLTSQQKAIEAKVFDRILRQKTPKEVGLDKYFKAQEEKFVLANYLDTIDGKKAPLSVPQRLFRKTSQLLGGTLGYRTFGPMGMFNGYQFGGLMSDTFMSIPNPVKISYLKSIGKTAPEIYQIMREYVSDAQARRMVTPLLKAGEKLKANYPVIPLGPYNSGPANTFANDFTQNTRVFGNTKMIGAPESRIIPPNTQGTPNQPIAPYPSNPEVGGMRQRIFKGKK